MARLHLPFPSPKGEGLRPRRGTIMAAYFYGFNPGTNNLFIELIQKARASGHQCIFATLRPLPEVYRQPNLPPGRIGGGTVGELASRLSVQAASALAGGHRPA